MSIILGNGDVFKDLHIGNKVINKAVVCNKVVWQKSSDWPGLIFTANQDNSTVGYFIAGTINKDIYTSTDGKTWVPWDGSDITLNNGQSIYVWNKLNTLSNDPGNYLLFIMSGSISASGNVNSMINFSELSDCCYLGMFSNCTSLTTAPDLPATTLASTCYAFMFNACTALTQAPDLPATNLDENCYYQMFYGCNNLSSIKLHYAGNFNTDFTYWVYNVSSTGTFYYNGSDTTRGNSAIPTGWEVQSF